MSSLPWNWDHTESYASVHGREGAAGPPAYYSDLGSDPWTPLQLGFCWSYQDCACLTQLPAYVLWQVTTEVISTNRGDIYHEVGIPAESWLRPISLFMRVYWTVCHRWDTHRATPDNLCVYCHCFGRAFFVFVLSLCNLIKSTIKIPKSLCEYVYPLKLEELLLWNKTKQNKTTVPLWNLANKGVFSFWSFHTGAGKTPFWTQETRSKVLLTLQ